ncbi:GntR family transcriptional regulator [Rhizobium sp. CSW-27]|uniref:GntR family transcriptional regulator n=1 Tax=Rhizobium sp. CSW-27 TaxID=2839985 RepID=UPI002078C0EB|nr:GntR family transcriptional regulator [Rhizobium sp. CSW-27]
MKASAPIGLGSIETVPLHEIVYQRLNRALMSGQIKPGQKLTSRKLAVELGTSDMPVRAALAKLQALKALEQLQNGSHVLPPMTRTRFGDLTKSRLICEPAATRQAAGLMSKTQLNATRKACHALTQAARDQDIDAYLLHNYEFKFSIYRASGIESLLFLIETLWLQIGPFLRQFSGQFGGDLAGILDIDYHEEVVAALERQEGDAAAALIGRDIAEGADYLLAHARFA